MPRIVLVLQYSLSILRFKNGECIAEQPINKRSDVALVIHHQNAKSGVVHSLKGLSRRKNFKYDQNLQPD